MGPGLFANIRLVLKMPKLTNTLLLVEPDNGECVNFVTSFAPFISRDVFFLIMVGECQLFVLISRRNSARHSSLSFLNPDQGKVGVVKKVFMDAATPKM